MARTWVMMIGLTLLWAATCPGDEAFVGPPEQAGDVVDPGAAEGPGTVEPTPDPGYEVVGSEPGSNAEVTEPKPDPGPDVIVSEPVDEGEVIDVRPDDGGEVVYVKPEIDDAVIYVEPLERDNRIYMMGAGNGSEADGAPRDVSSLAASMTAQDAYAWVLAQIPGDVLAGVGLPVGTGSGVYGPVDMSGPDLAQVRSTIGLTVGAQTGIFTNAIPNLPNFSAQFDTARSQFYGQANEVLSPFQTLWNSNPSLVVVDSPW